MIDNSFIFHSFTLLAPLSPSPPYLPHRVAAGPPQTPHTDNDIGMLQTWPIMRAINLPTLLDGKHLLYSTGFILNQIQCTILDVYSVVNMNVCILVDVNCVIWWWSRKERPSSAIWWEG